VVCREGGVVDGFMVVDLRLEVGGSGDDEIYGGVCVRAFDGVAYGLDDGAGRWVGGESVEEVCACKTEINLFEHQIRMRMRIRM